MHDTLTNHLVVACFYNARVREPSARSSLAKHASQPSWKHDKGNVHIIFAFAMVKDMIILDTVRHLEVTYVPSK